MKLSIGKLSRILKKAYKREIAANACDPYCDRLTLGYLTIHENPNTPPIVFEIRSFYYDPKRYKLRVHAINWIQYGGSCYILLNTENIKKFKFSTSYES